MTAQATARRPAEALALEGTRTLVVAGLVVGAVLGFGGNFVEHTTARSLMYAVSAVALIAASVLLAVEHAAAGHRLPAAGFLLLALGETRVLNPVDLPSGEAAFAVGVLLYAPALLLIASSRWSPGWARAVAALAAVLFAVHGLLYLAGADVVSTGPLAGAGYALLTLTLAGWIVTVLRGSPARS